MGYLLQCRTAAVDFHRKRLIMAKNKLDNHHYRKPGVDICQIPYHQTTNQGDKTELVEIRLFVYFYSNGNEMLFNLILMVASFEKKQ